MAAIDGSRTYYADGCLCVLSIDVAKNMLLRVVPISLNKYSKCLFSWR